ncbi:MAG: DUF547 domain-containing protein [Chloroflexi bacterium]|nr:DUF547 domain-containing protein [Chloroflexota bacterium]
MQNLDFLVRLRERALKILADKKETAILNMPAAQDTDQTSDPALTLRVELQTLLAGFVNGEGQVDYAALKTSPAYAAFQNKAAVLHGFDPSSLPTAQSRLAFWVNLYNTLILDAVITLGVRRSVSERMAGIGFFRQAAYSVGGQRLSADDIEHGILRLNRGHPYFYTPQFRSDDPRIDWVIAPFEPRIHFALNCASRSCPPIRAYLPEKLEAQLDLAARSFVSADLEILPEKGMIRISSIFKWFAGDFGGRAGTISFILSHLDDEGSISWLAAHREKARMVYKRYDWGLNGKV